MPVSSHQPALSTDEKLFRNRGYLPHLDSERPQFLTFRIAGALPAHVYQAIRERHAHRDALNQVPKMRFDIEEHLDSSAEVCWLEDPRIASIVQDSLLHFDRDRYRLHAWTIMPNHVHVLVSPWGNRSIGSIVKSWKTWTARHANQIIGRTGRFWADDYFDRAIRTSRQMDAVWSYIESNPVKAGLCRSPEEWPWGSASRDLSSYVRH